MELTAFARHLEHGFCKPKVRISILLTGTNKINDLDGVFFFLLSAI
jgi:hypothetical protein